MKIKLIDLFTNSPIEATINLAVNQILPSINDGWRFNFNKHSKKPGFVTYVLISKLTPNIIEGCLIFQMKSKIEPYMAFIEIAPHNKGVDRKLNSVAGCLIAFACRLSFIEGKNDYKGWLAFDVIEENEKDSITLMSMYCNKYGALKFNATTMIISPEKGQFLINKYLKS